MLQKKLNDIEADMSTFDKCNKILFANWKDNNAEAFNNAICQGINNQYTTYHSDAEALAKEMKLSLAEVEQSKYEIDKLVREINELCQNPSIRGCHVLKVIGRGNMQDVVNTEYCVLKKEEAPLINNQPALFQIAQHRCCGLTQIDEVHYGGYLG